MDTLCLHYFAGIVLVGANNVWTQEAALEADVIGNAATSAGIVLIMIHDALFTHILLTLFHTYNDNRCQPRTKWHEYRHLEATG